MGNRLPPAYALACIAALLVAVAACETHTTTLPVAPPVRVKPDTLTTLCLGDAYALAVVEMNKPGSPYLGQVEIPQMLVRELQLALLAVNGANTLPARDSVVAMFQIHPVPLPASLIIAVDTTYAWTAAWRRGETLTGEPEVDWLVAHYGLVLEEYPHWPGNYALLGTTRPLNLQPLALRFAGIAGVRYAQPNGVIGYNRDVAATRQDGGWRLDYKYGWGDCPAGCMAWHTWSFFVAADLSVTYLGSSGAPFYHRAV